MKLYWRFKKDGKWTWKAATPDEVKGLEPVAYAPYRFKTYQKEEEE